MKTMTTTMSIIVIRFSCRTVYKRRIKSGRQKILYDLYTYLQVSRGFCGLLVVGHLLPRHPGVPDGLDEEKVEDCEDDEGEEDEEDGGEPVVDESVHLILP